MTITYTHLIAHQTLRRQLAAFMLANPTTSNDTILIQTIVDGMPDECLYDLVEWAEAAANERKELIQ